MKRIKLFLLKRKCEKRGFHTFHLHEDVCLVCGANILPSVCGANILSKMDEEGNANRH